MRTFRRTKRNPMKYTLGQAAKATDMSKAALSRAIKTGRISATKNEGGSFEIDPAELHRVYPPKQAQLNDTQPQPTPPQQAEIERLKATVEGLERLCRQIEGERDSLREQNTKLTAILTDQRAQTKPPTSAEAKPALAAPALTKRRWWSLGGR